MGDCISPRLPPPSAFPARVPLVPHPPYSSANGSLLPLFLFCYSRIITHPLAHPCCWSCTEPRLFMAYGSGQYERAIRVRTEWRARSMARSPEPLDDSRVEVGSDDFRGAILYEGEKGSLVYSALPKMRRCADAEALSTPMHGGCQHLALMGDVLLFFSSLLYSICLFIDFFECLQFSSDFRRSVDGFLFPKCLLCSFMLWTSKIAFVKEVSPSTRRIVGSWIQAFEQDNDFHLLFLSNGSDVPPPLLCTSNPVSFFCFCYQTNAPL